MKVHAVLFAVSTAVSLAIGMPGAAQSQTEVIKPLNVQLTDMVTPVASYYASTPAIGAVQLAADERPPDPPAKSVPLLPPGFFPTYVSNPNNAPTLAAAQHHPVYVNQPPSHWGDPEALLRDLGKSEIIHVVDQYTGRRGDHRYTLGASYELDYTIPADHTIRMADLAAMVHAAASAGGAGYGQLYHVFLPEGVDACVRASVCYTPDIPATFTACAWHNEFIFSDLGPVIFTVEPYQNVPGCQVSPDHPVNGVLADSTDSTLSHEVFEAISDPALGGWSVRSSVAAGGQEIADLCDLSVVGADGNYYTSDTPVRLGSTEYVVTAIYSNKMHACTYGEGGPTW